MSPHSLRALVPLALLAFAAGCGGGSSSVPTASAPSLPQGGEAVQLDPSTFTANVDNPWWPMKPGSRWVYRETDAEGTVTRVEVTVMSGTKTIMGIESRIVHDVLTEDGEVKEDTYDWYAQDASGNLWYMGEDTKEFDKGKVNTEGSWEAGVDGAQPGILIPADPKPGMRYRQEYYAGHAEDNAQVLALDGAAVVPFGSLDHLLQTRETTPLEPDLVEEKFYARGIGEVTALTISGGSDREVLLSFTSG
ncbi:MAG: hypothetical protein ABI649_06375 [Gaiellaceae bacterium]